MNREEPKCRFYVSCGHGTVRTEPLDSGNGIVRCDEKKKKIILVNKMVYAGIP